MNVLMFTPKVDPSDPFLGFACGWIRALATQVDSLVVLTLDACETNLPPNITIYSLNKSRVPHPLFLLPRFLKTVSMIFSRHRVDVIFCHMFPEFTLLMAPFAALYGKPIVMWYAHKNVSLLLRVAEAFATKIVTSSAEGFRLPSPKKVVVGQGIDTDFFKPLPGFIPDARKFVSVGRISPIKDYETLVAAMSRLRTRGFQDLMLDVIGEPLMPQGIAYLASLKQKVLACWLEKTVCFLGGVAFSALPTRLRGYGVFLHASRTGSIDKAALEAMSTGLLLLTSNIALKKLLGAFGEPLFFAEGDSTSLAKKIEFVLSLDQKQRARLSKGLRRRVVEKHSIKNLANNVVNVFRGCLA